MRRFWSLILAGLLVAMGLTSVSLPSASALSPGLQFSATDQPTWQTNGTVWALAQAGDQVFAGGTFTQLSPPAGTSGAPTTVYNLSSFDAATGNPGSCRPAITASTGTATVRALASSPDGKTLYIGGYFTHVGNVAVARLAALDVASCTVTAFRPGSISATVRALAVTDSTVYLGGDFQTVRGVSRGRFAAVARDTGALLGWTADADSNGRALAASPDGSMVGVGGDFFTVNGQDSHSFAVVDAVSGEVRKTYPRGFVPDTSVTKAITTDGASFYVGNEGTGGGVFDGRFAVDFASLDQRWRDTCLGATQAVLVHDATLYSANHAHDCSSMGWQPDGRRVYLMAETTEGPEVVGWKPDLNDGVAIGPRALVTASKGGVTYLWVGGEFTSTNGKNQRGLTRFASGPASAAPEAPSRVTAESLKAGEIQVRWRTSYDGDDSKLTYRVYRSGTAAPIAEFTADSYWWHLPQASFIDKNAQPGADYTYRVTVSDGTSTMSSSQSAGVQAASANAPYAATVLKDGANLYWRYNETGDIYGADSSSGNRNLLFMKSPTLRTSGNVVTSEDGFSIGFDGTASYAYSDTIAEAPGTYSVETWFRTDSTTGGKIIGYGSGVPRTDNLNTRLSNNYDRHVYMTDGGQLIFGVYSGGTRTVKTSGVFNDNEWHQVVATQGSNGMALYVDGKLAAKNSIKQAQAYGGSWRVGGDNLSGWPDRPVSNFFRGGIDETSVYPTALTPTQVLDHYSKSGRTAEVPAAPKDAYGASVFSDNPDFFWRFEDPDGGTAADNGLLGTSGLMLDGAHFADGGIVGRAADLGGTGLISTSTSFVDPRQYSLELWFNSETSTGGRLIGFSNNQTGRSNSYDRHIYMTDEGRLIFGTWTGQQNTVTSTGTYRDGGWHHVVATQSADGMKLYVDGALAGTNPQVDAQSYDGYWKVGADNVWAGASSPYLQGKVDEVAVYSTVLKQEDVSEHYSLGAGVDVPDTQAPTVPEDLAATVKYGAVSIAWTASTDDVAVQEYVVYRSANAAFPTGSTTRIGTSEASPYVDQNPGSGTWHYRLVAMDAAGNLSGPSVGTSATIAGPDTEPPGSPGNVRAVVKGTDVDLQWDAASDNTAVTAYRIYRSDRPDFDPGTAPQVGETTETSYGDLQRPEGKWYYRVIAADAAGNVSPASATVSATITPPLAEPTVVELAPVEDAMVNQHAAGTNLGASNQMASRGTPGYISYLKFDLPQAPAGTHLSGAKLSLRATTASYAGSADAHDVYSTGTAWSEKTLTYASRPAVARTPFGQFPAGTKVGAAITAELDPPVLTTALGTQTALAITSGGSDNIWFWSKEQANSSYRPVLTLTFEAGTNDEAGTK